MKCREFPESYEKELVLNYAVNRTLTRLLNSLSLLFPEGERFFVRAVREFENEYSEQLKEDAKIFYKQEARHSMEHQKLNKMLGDHGVDYSKLEAKAKERLYAAAKTPKEKLLVTHCLELLTGFGGWLLPNIQSFILKDNNISKLWKIHALEEKEHVHVAENALKEIYNPSKLEIIRWFCFTSKELALQTYENYKELKKIDRC